MRSESWLPIQHSPGYEVSDLGNVRSVRRCVTELGTGRVRVQKGRQLKASLSTGGYPTVVLCVGGKHKNYSVHRLVAEAFCDRSGGPHVRHLDGTRTNNVPSNLRWGTRKENYADMVRHGRRFAPPGFQPRFEEPVHDDIGYVAEALA